MSDYEHHLLPYLEPSKIMTLSCGHVIPSSNLLAVPIVKTHRGTEFDFTFEKRNSEQMVSYNDGCPREPVSCAVLCSLVYRAWHEYKLSLMPF
jgi:hypothetical protein